MSATENLLSMTVQGLNAALVPIVFLYLLWKREWTWTGLISGLCIGFTAWFHVSAAIEGIIAGSGQLAWPILRAALYIYSMAACLLRPRQVSTILIVAVCLSILFSSAIPAIRWTIGLDRLDIFTLRGMALPGWAGLITTVAIALAPSAFTVPWAIHRQSVLRESLMSPVSARFALVSGIAFVAFALLTAAIMSGGFRGTGPFSGEPITAVQSGARSGLHPIVILILLVGTGLATFWALRRAFIEPAIALIEALRGGESPETLSRLPAIWQPLFLSIERDRKQASDDLKELEEARAQLAALFEHAPVAIALSDMSGKHQLANRAVEDLYGIPADELLDKPGAWLFEHFENFEDFAPHWETLVKTGKPMRIEAVFRPESRDEPRNLDLIVFPIRAADGTIKQIGSLAIDLTARREAERALAEREAQLSGLFDHAPIAMQLHRLDGRTILATRHVRETYGVSAETLTESKIESFAHHWPEFDRLATASMKAVMERELQRLITPFKASADAQAQIYDVMVFPIRSANGTVIQFGSLGIDVTAQKMAETALVEQQAQIHQSEKLAALGQLLAGVAHELNNPLTVVVGRSAILHEKLQDTPHGKAIADLREAADRCNRIVRTFLAMARQSAPRRAAVQVNDAIEAALDMTAYGLRSSGIELVRQFDERLPEVEGDEDQLVQVFTNLLINARHALEEHHPEGGRVTITTQTKEGKLVVEIADNGPGVSGDNVSRIFEPFFTTKAVGDGTGMGLAMSRGMIEEHGGKLLYSDAEGGGAAFTVELPIATAPVSAKPEGDIEQPHGKGRGHVLVIDDEPSIRGLLVEILEGIELACTQCGDGAAAFELLAQQKFDLVFCDVRMPVMDGVRFRQHVAETHPELLGRLVFISGDVLQRGNARRAEIAGHAFVEKPFNPVEVRKLALSLLDGEGDMP